MTNLLLIEDEPGLTLTLTDLLTTEGYQLETVADGAAGFALACDKPFAAIILDVNLPSKNGFDVCRELRARGIRTPILMLTARGQLVDKVLGLKLGADDYQTKPFEPLELLARVEALLRRAPAAANELPDTFRFGAVVINFNSTEVRFHNQLIEISAREFELLRYFVQRRGLTIPRSQLLREVWGYDEEALTRTVDVHIGALRQKLEEDAKNPRHFLTIRGLGYKFVE